MAAILEDGKLRLSGYVGDYYYSDGFTSSDVVVALAGIEDTDDLDVYVNSGGGIATEGAAIHALLAARAGTTNIIVEGIAASAASLIAMAGETVTMSAGAVMMIHDPSGFTVGTVADHNKQIEALEALATAYARVYATKSGKTADECRGIMREEHWYTPEQAVEAGFADETTESKATAAAPFPYQAYAHAPKRLTALAARKDWRLPDADTRAASSAATNPKKEKPVSDQNKADAATAGLAKASADAKNRIKAIMTSDEAKGRSGLAEHFAYDTEMSAEDAIAALGKAGKDGSGKTDAEMFEERRMNGENLNGGRPGGRQPLTTNTTLSAVMNKVLGNKEVA